MTLTSDCFSFLIRCARGGCGAKSPSPESPGGSQLQPTECELVSSELWGPHHTAVLHSFRDKAGWKINGHHSPYRTPQLTAHFLFADHRLRHLLLCCAAQCSPGTCSLYSNPPRGSALPPATVTPRRQVFPLFSISYLH